VPLDAANTLEELTRNGILNIVRFRGLVGALIEQARGKGGEERRRGRGVWGNGVAALALAPTAISSPVAG